MKLLLGCKSLAQECSGWDLNPGFSGFRTRSIVCGAGLVAQSCPTLATPRAAARQAPLSMGFSRQEYRVGCHFLVQGIFPNQGLNSCLLHWQADSLPLSHLGGCYIVCPSPSICFCTHIENPFSFIQRSDSRLSSCPTSRSGSFLPCFERVPPIVCQPGRHVLLCFSMYLVYSRGPINTCWMEMTL